MRQLPQFLMKKFKPKTYPNKKRIGKARSARHKGYDSTWERYRRRFLYHNPYCYCCNEKATVVDHIDAHKNDETKFKKLDNHMPLCKKHHDTITAKFDRHEVPDIEGKISYINDLRKYYGVSRKIKVLAVYEK